LTDRLVHNLSIIATLNPVQGSLRERSPGVWQVRVSVGRDPVTKRYRYVSSTVRGGRRAAEREAARLVKQAADGKIPLERETLAGLLERWLEHIEARGRAPKTLLENRRMATAISEELGTKELRRLCGRDLDAFYDGLRRRGLSATSARRYHAVLSAALNQAVRWGLLEHSPVAQANPPSLERNEAPAPSPERIRELHRVCSGQGSRVRHERALWTSAKVSTPLVSALSPIDKGQPRTANDSAVKVGGAETSKCRRRTLMARTDTDAHSGQSRPEYRPAWMRFFAARRGGGPLRVVQ
jgi:hypothetical protein